MTAPMTNELPLRERKKLRTRQALIDSALELFGERGFGGVTLDELCDSVEVSKRTFFRYFSSKEDVAMAPTQDLWLAFLDELETREPGDRPVLEMLRDALFAAVERMAADGRWTRRVLISRQLAASTPSMDAHGLHFCHRTSRAALELLHRRLDFAGGGGGGGGAAAAAAPVDLRPRLAVDMLVAAFHCALDAWVPEPGMPVRGELAAHVRDACAALPGSLTLTATLRTG
ncbi:TetR/AcrR family transcriptional regulator [Streptomyces flavidovirens]|uniref:TetR/AcrR family transcriptional regulator n=1 Tax=Streptomyces flavidovirens TaxID=67298 RepID=UPI000405E4DE|nr:TetR family transcriptional regulator [Streptomyces flavidovirens]